MRVLTGPFGFGQRNQSGRGACERLLYQLRLALEVLIVLRVHDQRGSHDLVRDAVKRVVLDPADQVAEGVRPEDPHSVAQPPPTGQLSAVLLPTVMLR